MAEQRLQRKFPQLDPLVVKYVLTDVAGGNYDMAQETVQSMTSTELDELASSLKGVQRANLTPQQKELVKQFKGVGGGRDKTAVKWLSQNSWNLEAALNAFFTAGGADDADDGDDSQLEELFERYRTLAVQNGAAADTNFIEGSGLGSFCDDLDKDDPDLPVLLIAWIVQAQKPWSLSREEFVGGLAEAGVTNLQSLQRQVAVWKTQIRNEDSFSEFYKFCYDWMRSDAQSRSLEFEAACDLWTILLPRWPLMPQWTEYIKTKFKKAISRDVWNQFLDFSRLQPDLSNYDPSGAWPCLIDEFVEHCGKKEGE